MHRFSWECYLPHSCPNNLVLSSKTLISKTTSSHTGLNNQTCLKKQVCCTLMILEGAIEGVTD